MVLLHELIIIVIIGGLISVGAYDALKSFIKYLLEKLEDRQWEEPREDGDYEREDEVDEDDLIDEIKDDIEEIADDAEDIVDDTTHGILKPIVGAVKLVGKVAKKGN